MGTRCAIGITNRYGSVDAAFCARDGYPEGVGRKLLEHYHDPARIRAMIALGALNSLGNSPDDPRSYQDLPPLGPDDDLSTSFQDIENHCFTLPGRTDLYVGLQAATAAEFPQIATDQGLDFAYLYHDSQWQLSAVRDPDIPHLPAQLRNVLNR